MSESSRLCKVFWCIQIDKPLVRSDQVFFNFMRELQLPVQLVFTKADKLSNIETFDRVMAFTHKFKPYTDLVSPFAHIVDHNGAGIPELRMAVKQAVLECPTRVVKKKAGRIHYTQLEAYSQKELDQFKLLIERDRSDVLTQLEE